MKPSVNCGISCMHLALKDTVGIGELRSSGVDVKLSLRRSNERGYLVIGSEMR